MYPERKTDKLLLGFPFEALTENAAIPYLLFF